MEVENILAKNIAAAGDKAAYDACCKRLLANKIILAWIMKSCLEEYKDYDVQTIAEKYIEGDPQISAISVNPDEEQIQGSSTEDVTIQEGTITYNIRFFAIVPISGEFVRLMAPSCTGSAYPLRRSPNCLGTKISPRQKSMQKQTLQWRRKPSKR